MDKLAGHRVALGGPFRVRGSAVDPTRSPWKKRLPSSSSSPRPCRPARWMGRCDPSPLCRWQIGSTRNVVKHHPDNEMLGQEWMIARDPIAARAGWNLTAERVVKDPDGLVLPALRDRIGSEMATAAPEIQCVTLRPDLDQRDGEPAKPSATARRSSGPGLVLDVPRYAVTVPVVDTIDEGQVISA